MNDETKKEEVKAQETTAAEGSDTQAVEASAEKKNQRKPRGRKPSGRKPQNNLDPEMEERVVAVNRVAKVVKGGRRFSFSALMVVGDKKGNVGYGLGKAKEVPEAIRKATQAAQRHMVHVPIDKGTIPHQILGEFDAGKILFKPAAEGTGIKAAGACRSILELAGVKNVLTKSLRGNNTHNIVKATFMALKNLRSPEKIANLRGVDVSRVRIK
jgi:small subunit ribosomal protein S5